MSHTLTIAAREFRERRFVFALAAAAALIPFASALLPYARRSGPGSVISLGGLILSAGVTLALAIMLGASVVGRELSEQRLSFYLSKPVTGGAIWFGKLIGALATLAVCFAIIFVPSVVFAPGVWNPANGTPPGGFALLILVSALYMFLVAHTFSIIIRSRSGLAALDLALLFVCGAAAWLILRPLVVNVAWKAAAATAAGLVASFAIATAGAGYWQISRGGTEVRRSHRELSRFLWSAMLVAVIIAAAFSAWVLSPSPADIATEQVAASDSSEWVAVRGRAKYRLGFQSVFLLNTRTHESMRLPAAGQYLSFSSNGQALVSVLPLVITRGVTSNQGEVHVQNLRDSRSDTGTGIETSIRSGLALSDDQSRLAVFSGSRVLPLRDVSVRIPNGVLSVHDLRRNALLASVRIPNGQDATLFFSSPNIVRVYARNWWQGRVAPDELWIYEYDVTARRLQQTGYYKSGGSSFAASVSADGSKLLMRHRGAILVLDARTAAVQTRIEATPGFATLLADGGVAIVPYRPAVEATLQIFDARGSHVRDVPLGGKRTGPIREVVAGRTLVMTVFRTDVARDVIEIDLLRGTISRRHSGAMALVSDRRDDTRISAPNPSGDYIVLSGTAQRQELWLCNAVTGAKKKVL